MMALGNTYLPSSEAARLLGIHPMSIQQLCRGGKLRAEKIANRWLVRRDDLDEFAKTYVPAAGRPRQKRKYTRRQQA
jgi:excisionase family DNA binding protein